MAAQSAQEVAADRAAESAQAAAVPLRWADAALRRYQRQMGALEMPAWEQSVEQRSAHSYGGAPRKTTKPAAELIDLDLVRGSTFPKAKVPQQGVWLAVRHGLPRALALPLYRHWWCRHVGGRLFLVLLTAYLLYASALFVKLTSEETTDITVAELLTPLLVGCALSVIKWQVVARQETRRSGTTAVVTDSSSSATTAGRPKRRRKSRAAAAAHSDAAAIPSLARLNSVSTDSLGSHLDEVMAPVTCVGSHMCREPTQRTWREATPAVSKQSKQTHERQPDSLKVSSDLHAALSVSDTKLGINGIPSAQPARLESTGFLNPSASTSKPLLSARSASDELVTRNRRRLQQQESHHRSLSADSLPCMDACRAACRPDSHVSGCRARVVRIADRPEQFCCYRTDSSDSKSDAELGDELSAPSSSTSALSKTAAAGGGGGSLDAAAVRRGARASLTTDSSAGELSCAERRRPAEDAGGARRSLAPRRLSVSQWRRRWSGAAGAGAENTAAAPHHTSGSESEAGYSSGAAPATSGGPQLTVTWDPLLNQAADRTGCIIWEGADLKKVDLTTLDICSVIVNRVEAMPQSTDYMVFGIVMAALISLLPSLCRLGASSALSDISWQPPLPIHMLLVSNLTSSLSNRLVTITDAAFGSSASERLIIIVCCLVTFLVTSLLYFVLSVVERSFKQRLLYAKYFCYLTSARRAKKFELPHFRLKKVRNIKTWLSVRSCLKKRGPQRSVDTIVSTACVTTVVLVTCLCVELLENSDSPRIDLYRCQLVLWCFSLGVYLVRLMSLGSYINCKYRNLSVVLTEQINVHLQIEQKPHKKDRLVLANNVLKLASELLKELERPFTVLGFSANPFLYNATKVIVLSACSGVLSDMLGFKLKLYKIKLK